MNFRQREICDEPIEPWRAGRRRSDEPIDPGAPAADAATSRPTLARRPQTQ